MRKIWLLLFILSGCGLFEGLGTLARITGESDKFYVLANTHGRSSDYRLHKIGLIAGRREANVPFEGRELGPRHGISVSNPGQILDFSLQSQGELLVAAYTFGFDVSRVEDQPFAIDIYRTSDLERTARLTQEDIFRLMNRACNFNIDGAEDRFLSLASRSPSFDLERAFTLTWKIEPRNERLISFVGWDSAEGLPIVRIDANFFPTIEQDGRVLVGEDPRYMATRFPIWSLSITWDGKIEECLNGIMSPAPQPRLLWEVVPLGETNTLFTVEPRPGGTVYTIIEVGGDAVEEDVLRIPGKVTHIQGPFQ